MRFEIFNEQGSGMSSINKMGLAGVYGLLVLITALIHAEIYQWRDEQGNLQFSDSPPDDKKAETVDLKPISGYSPTADHQRAGERLAERSQYHRPVSSSSSNYARAQKAKRTQREANAKASKQSRCASYRSSYRSSTLQRASTTSRARANAKAKKRLRGKIKEYCR